MKKIEVNLPLGPQYEGIEFVAKPSSSYNPQEAASGLAEFLDLLYHQLPYSVVEKLQKDHRISNFRRCLQDEL